MYKVQYREGYGESWRIKEGLYTLAEACKLVVALMDMGYKAQYSFTAHRMMPVSRRYA